MKPAIAILWTAAAAAQTLQFYSEFQRIDPFGALIDAGPAHTPREILSPAVARNAWTSFHLAASAAEGVPSFLYIQQNPEWFRVDVYRERYSQTRAGWIPDRLDPIQLPYTFVFPEKQTTVVFWVDIWVPAETPPERMRLQALLKTGDLWLVSPLEVRVQQTVVPTLALKPGPTSPATARLDAALAQPWCGAPGVQAAPLTLRQMLRRNALQDKRLAPAPPPEIQSWCQSLHTPDPEWYLRVRDRLLRRPN